MSVIQKIFAYNTGSLISGTTQVGDIAVSEADVEYSANYGGLQWWGGPDETLGYVIAHSDPSRVPDYLGFWRSDGLSDSDFLNLCNSIPPRIGFPPFTNTNDAYTWLNSNGYWTSFIPVTLTPTPTNDVTPTVTPTISLTPTNTPTPTVTNTPTTTPTISLTPTNTSTPTTTPTPTPTSAATASFAVSMIESGSDVVLSYSGILDLTGLNYVQDTNAGGGGVGPAQGAFGIGPTGFIPVSLYTGATFSYPANFGSGVGSGTQPYGSGNYFGVFSGILPTNSLVVPTGYTSGNYIQGSTTMSASTFSSLGMTAGSYNYSWGAGAGQSFVLTIGGAGVTPTPTATSVTPTPTPTSVTGYGYNLVVMPYQPATSGNTIFPTFATPGLGIGTTNPNTFNVNGIYWNAIDNSSVDRTSYYSGMTGVSVTAYFTQNGNTAIYSGSPTAFTFDISEGANFNYNPQARPGQLVLTQSASTNFVTGQTVNISYVVN
jgi:hypothetical protein